MKKTSALLAAGLLVMAAAFSGETSPDPCSAVNETAIRIHLPLKKFTIESKKPRKGLCEVIVRVGDQLIPVYAGHDFMIAGDLYAYRKKITDESITAIKAKMQEEKRKMFREKLPLVEKSVAIVYRPKKRSQRVIYFFTDPLCPYCHEAGKELRKLADKLGVTVKVLLFSVHGKRGEDKSVEAICRNFSFERYNNLKWKTSDPVKKYLCKKGREKVKAADSLSDTLGVEGVPAFYLDNGFYVSGGDMKKIEKELIRLGKK